jgi:hypothetical protein
MKTPRQLADRVTVLGSVDLTGFAPFLSPVMFSVNENLWSTITLIASLVAILLITFVIVGRRSGVIATSPHGTSPLPQ